MYIDGSYLDPWKKILCLNLKSFYTHVDFSHVKHLNFTDAFVYCSFEKNLYNGPLMEILIMIIVKIPLQIASISVI